MRRGKGNTRSRAMPDLDLNQLARTLSGLRHVTRLRIMATLLGGGPSSPSKLAAALGEPLGNVSYHVRPLLEAGLIRPTGEAQIRGAIEHWYELTDRGRLLAVDLALDLINVDRAAGA